MTPVLQTFLFRAIKKWFVKSVRKVNRGGHTRNRFERATDSPNDPTHRTSVALYALPGIAIECGISLGADSITGDVSKKSFLVFA